MRVNPRLPVLAAAVVVLTWAACGGAGEGTLGPTGGDVCLPGNQVCIEIPSGGLETQELIRISETTEVPEGALSPGYDISAASGKPLTFVKPATVSFSLDLVNQDGISNENLLRLYTLETLDGGAQTWQPLRNALVDRVKNVVRGETLHLSPFVVLRTDRLPDGGLPFELDAGRTDASVVVIPPFDAGRPDAGRVDAGTPDAGRPDAGTPDAGTPDAGTPDAGTPDAGVDAGIDAGVDAGIDAGVDAGVDAGLDDAGVDAGLDDAGVDAGLDDAGVDAGLDDAGADAGLDDAGIDAG